MKQQTGLHSAALLCLTDLPYGLHGVPLAAAGDKIYTLSGSIRAGAIENRGDGLVYPGQE